MKSLLLASLLVATVLAGCSDGGAPPDDCDPADPSCVVTTPPASGKGHIVGVVVDETITPLAGATVTLTDTEFTARSDDRGAFLFENLDPKTYFVQATKAGYTTIQQQVTVEAGSVGDTLRLRIEAIPGEMPDFAVESFEGFLECSAGAAADVDGVVYTHLFYSACSSPNTYSNTLCNLSGGQACVGNVNNDKFDERYVLEKMPDFVQSELVWEGTTAAGGVLSLMYSVPATGTPNDYVWNYGTSPVKITANATTLAAEDVGVGEDALPLWIRVFPYSDVDSTPVAPGAVIQQKFQVFTVFFYNFEPPEDYLYSESGDPEVPE